MRSDHHLQVITHCHTVQSRNRASPMDAYIRSAVERVTGESAEGFDWSESLTTARQIELLLSGRGEQGRADLVFVTDHVNETTTGFDPELVELAIREPRIAIGVELQTVLEAPPGSGSYLHAPEVLIYGSPEPVPADGGRHYGINPEILTELLEQCRAPRGRRPELLRVLAWCRERRFAHVLAHPLDGHFLDLDATLQAMGSCRFLETVNGGFSGDSARRLERFVRLFNTGLIPGWSGYRPPGLVPWGGSDAHLGRYDRVCVRYRPPVGPMEAGVPSLLRDMLETPTEQLLAERVFTIDGKGNDLLSCLVEVMRLIEANAGRNRETFRGLRRRLRLAVIGPWFGLKKVLQHRRHQRRLGRELDRRLDEIEGGLPTPSQPAAPLLPQ